MQMYTSLLSSKQSQNEVASSLNAHRPLLTSIKGVTGKNNRHQQLLLTSRSRATARSSQSNKSHREMLFQRVQSIIGEKRNPIGHYVQKNGNSVSGFESQSQLKKVKYEINQRHRSTTMKAKDQKVQILNQIVKQLKKAQLISNKNLFVRTSNHCKTEPVQSLQKQKQKNHPTNKLGFLLNDIKSLNKQNFKAIYTIKKSKQRSKQYENSQFQYEVQTSKNVLEIPKKIVRQKNKTEQSCITCGCICNAKKRAKGDFSNKMNNF